MPTLMNHSHYWQTAVEAPPDVGGGSGSGGFTPWQVVILTACLLVMCFIP